MKTWVKLVRRIYEETDNVDEFIQRLQEQFNFYGYFVAFQNRCWCYQRTVGPDHSDSCVGKKQDELMRELENS